MQIALRSKLAKSLAIFLQVTVVLGLIVLVSKTYIAYVVGRRATVRNLRLAVKLDPGNPDYHLKLGRLYQYSLTEISPDLAMYNLKRATELNPYDPRAWLDLGAALEFQGRTTEAEACLRRADFLAPNLSTFQWDIGNFFLLHGNVEEAFHHFRVVLAGSSKYNQIIFNIAWKAAGDANEILTKLIPNHIPAEFDYLYYLLPQKRYLEAQNVWKRIASNPDIFPLSQVAPYIDDLIRAHRPQEAYQVWTDLRNKGLIKPTYQGTSRNLIVNGDFEEEPLNMGFDWRIGGVEGVYAGLDESQYHSAGHALLIEFPGHENLDYHHVFQYVGVTPGHSYRLRGFMKTEGITTDRGPRLEVRDAYDPNYLDKFSEPLTGTTGGWTELALDFSTGPKTELIVVGIARLPSRKFDNKIAGRVWVDDLRLDGLEE
jgi:tetratricopeptide (TPR) repeat protein